MSENDDGLRGDEHRDPTSGSDWAAPYPSGPDATGSTDATGSGDDRPASPTEHLPQGGQGGQLPPPLAQDVPQPPEPGAYDPYAGSSSQPSDPYAAAPPPPPVAPYGAAPSQAYDPYAATGGQAPQPGYPAYQAPGQWQGYPATPAAPENNTSALVLTILSGIGTVSCCLPMIAPLIMGIIALTKNSTDPAGSRRLSKWGWIVFGICFALSIIAVVTLVALGAAGVFDDGGSYNYDNTY